MARLPIRGNKITQISPKQKVAILRVLRDAGCPIGSAAIGLAGSQAAPGIEFYNIGTGRSHSVSELVELSIKATGRSVQVVDLEQPRRNEIMDCYCDAARFTGHFGWRPTVEIAEGLERTLAAI